MSEAGNRAVQFLGQKEGVLYYLITGTGGYYLWKAQFPGKLQEGWGSSEGDALIDLMRITEAAAQRERERRWRDL